MNLCWVCNVWLGFLVQTEPNQKWHKTKCAGTVSRTFLHWLMCEPHCESSDGNHKWLHSAANTERHVVMYLGINFHTCGWDYAAPLSCCQVSDGWEIIEPLALATTKSTQWWKRHGETLLWSPTPSGWPGRQRYLPLSRAALVIVTGDGFRPPPLLLGETTGSETAERLPLI